MAAANGKVAKRWGAMKKHHFLLAMRFCESIINTKREGGAVAPPSFERNDKKKINLKTDDFLPKQIQF